MTQMGLTDKTKSYPVCRFDRKHEPSLQVCWHIFT